MKAIEKAWQENLQEPKGNQWKSKEEIIENLCPYDYRLKASPNCNDGEDNEICTKCWNCEIEEDNEKDISTSIDNKLTFNKLEFSPISDINLDDANEDGLIESIKRNDYIICAHNSFDYNKIPVFIKWLQDVYDYCTELKNKVEYVDFNTAKLHMYNGNKAKFKDCTYWIENDELYFNLYSKPKVASLSLIMTENKEWILL